MSLVHSVPTQRPSLATIAALTLTFALPLTTPAAMAATAAEPAVYFVSPTGNDLNSGGYWDLPLRTVQKALDLAQPGDEIILAPGEYAQDFHTVRDGQAGAPIRISGTSTSRIKGAGKSHIIDINHSYIELSNLEINGQAGTTGTASDYRDILVYVKGLTAPQGVTGIKIDNVIFKNAGGECLRMKYFAHHNEISHSRFYNCGVWAFKYLTGGKNGEAIYIGTAPEQLASNPTPQSDASNNNWIHNNYFDTQGNECVDIKEGASYNTAEHNWCTGQKDPESGGMSSRGSNNLFAFNMIYSNAGVGIRLGGDTASDGIHNQVIGNTLKNNAVGSMRIMTAPQDAICGNRVTPVSSPVSGTHGSEYNPQSPCP
ncbi:MAG: DUF1565 domain-containing protein [Gammaproteobacteria bacterium]